MSKADNHIPDSFADAEFPSRGIDVGQAYGMQRVGTTPVGVNVRTYEPSTDRARGGSRPGLSKYIDWQVWGESEIQLLDYIVDPTVDATLADETTVGITDPSTNNLHTRNPAPARTVRRKGSGRQPIRVKKSGRRKPKLKTRLTLIQTTGATWDAVGGCSAINPITFTSPVTAGSLLVVTMIRYYSAATPTLSDTLGNSYSLAASSSLADVPPQNNKICAIWYVVTTIGGVNRITFTPDPAGISAYTIASIYEFSGQAGSSLDGILTGSAAAAFGPLGPGNSNPVTASVGGAAISDDKDVLLVLTNGFVSSPPSECRQNISTSTTSSLLADLSSGTTVIGGVTYPIGGYVWAAASFKKQTDGDFTVGNFGGHKLGGFT